MTNIIQATPTLHPLLARLVTEFHYPLLDESTLAQFTSQDGNTVLFCAGDPIQHPECLDVAVVLPELDKAMPDNIRYALCASSLESTMQARYGFNRWPTLVFLRNGEYVGIISGIQDWSVYLEKIATLLHMPSSRPPSIGIAVSNAHSASCH